MRLYSLEEYESAEASPKPEILTSQPLQAVLKLKSLGVADVVNFDWVEVRARFSFWWFLRQTLTLRFCVSGAVSGQGLAGGVAAHAAAVGGA